MMRPGSITLRLAVLFSSASTLVLLLMGALIIREVDMHFEEMDLDALDARMSLLEHGIAGLTSAADLQAFVKTHFAEASRHDPVAVTVTGADHRPLVPATIEFPPALLSAPAAGATPGGRRSLVWDGKAGRYRGMARTLATGIAEEPRLDVALAIDIRSHDVFVDSFLRGLAGSVLGGIALTVLLSWLVAHRGLAPVHAIARVAKHISAESLGERLPLASVPAELVDLARAFNDMLDRLETSFQRLSDFSSDLAHELRTPISNVMTQTQVALSGAASAEEYREALYSNLEEHERLARMISDMLLLAKADHGLMVPSEETVDLAAELRSLFAFYEAYGDEQGVKLALSGEASVIGDRLMIRRAVSNLLSNAIRHSLRPGTVVVELRGDAEDAVALSVENRGPDIPPEHIPRLFDRFYRVDPSRSNAGEGAGLGLAITHSIARAHGAGLEVSSTGGRTRFTLSFPRRG